MTSPLKRIPYDILREIMLYTYVFTFHTPFEEPEFHLQATSPPIAASQVCRAWRQSLLSDSTMWTCLFIFRANDKWIMELLRRSNTALLHVFLDVDEILRYTNYKNCDKMQRMLFSVFHEIYRFRTLRLRMNHGVPRLPSFPSIEAKTVEHILSYLQQPAPKLQVLSSWYDKTDSDDNSIPEYSIVDNLFSKNAPNIKRINHRLSLTSAFSASDCSAFHDLSELCLTLFSEVDFNRFLDILVLSPSLKSLRVCVDGNSYTTVTWNSSEIRNRLILPHLENLFLDAQHVADLVQSFFQVVIVPPNIGWYIFLENSRGFESSSLVRFLSRENLEFLHIETETSTLTKYLHLFSGKNSIENDYNCSYTNEFVYAHRRVDNSTNFWDLLMNAVVLTKITHIVLIDLWDFSEVSRLFASTSNLKDLVIKETERSGNDAIECSRCLGILIPPSKELMGYFPKLQPGDPWLEFLGVESVEANVPAHNSSTPITIPASPLCPLLTGVTLELLDRLEEKHARLLRACSDLRGWAGFPIELIIHCPSMSDEAARILQLKEDGTGIGN